MIIVEGPDGAGKSTLVRHLRGRFNLAEGLRGTTDRKRLYTVTVPDTMRALLGAIDGREPAHVWDRLYYSELVYHDLAPGRPCEFNATQRSVIERLIEALRCPVILCLPPFEVVRANALKEEQMGGVNENIETVYTRYVSLYHDGTLPGHTMVHDYTSEANFNGLNDIVAEIKDYLDERSQRSWSLPALPTPV